MKSKIKEWKKKSKISKLICNQSLNLKTEKGIEEAKEKLTTDIKKSEEAISQKENEIAQCENSIRDIQEPLAKIMDVFNASPLDIVVADKISKEEIALTTQTVKCYLATVEEYISTYMALIGEKNNLSEDPILFSMTDISPHAKMEMARKPELGLEEGEKVRSSGVKDEEEVVWDYS